MPRSSLAQRLSIKTREPFSVYLTEENNDLIRDYRFTMIMQTHNTELTLIDVVDEVFKNFREYLNDSTKINIRDNAKKQKKIRTVLTFRIEDKKLIQEYRLKRIMTTKDINFTLTDALNEVVNIFRAQLQLKKFEIMVRPEIVRASEKGKAKTVEK